MTKQYLRHYPRLRMSHTQLKFALLLLAPMLLLFAFMGLPMEVSADDQVDPSSTDSAPVITTTPTPTTYTIAGTVRDHQGQPVANVIVNYTISSVVSAGSPDNIAQGEPAPDLLQKVVRDEESSEQPADLAVTSNNPQATAATVFTDAQGRYTIAVSANTYRIAISRFGYFPPPFQTVTVPPSRTDVDFTFLPPHTVAGYVRDDAGNPVVNADVTYFTSLSDFGSVETDANGHYSLTVGAGPHRISVSKAGYLKPAEQPVTVPPDHNNINFTLNKCAAGDSTAPASCYHWAGTSDAGRITALDVLADGATWTNFTLSTRATAGPCSLTITTTVLSSGNILDSKFGSSGGTFSFSGQFSDSNNASGTYQYNDYIFGCGFLSKSGTWTANGALPAPIITQQPLSQTIAQGAAATISVAATGSPPLRYQWYQGNRGDTSVPLTAATSPTLTVFSLVNSTSYWVRVTNAQGLTNDSSAAILTVNLTPTPTHTPTPTNTPTPTPSACPTDSVLIPGGCATITPTPTQTPTPTSASGTCPPDSVLLPGGCATITPTPLIPGAATPIGLTYLSVIMKAPPTPTPTAPPTATATPTVSPTPTSTSLPPLSPIDGLWRGTTSQDKEISFRVYDHGFTFMSVDFLFNLAGCSVSGPTWFWQAQPIPINGNTFSVSVSNNTTVTGTFDSNTAVSGTLQVKVNMPGCSGSGNATWSATKQP